MDKIYEICFSPTGGTKRVAAILAKALADETVSVDLTARDVDFGSVTFGKDDVAMIAVPSYSGRVPAVAAARLAEMHGNGARAILVCVYGNRAYEDTLVELRDTASRAGFTVIAAVAAVAEHSIARQYAAGRPDADDEAVLCNFAERIRRKIDNGDTGEPEIPGNRPYRKAAGAGIVPKAIRVRQVRRLCDEMSRRRHRCEGSEFCRQGVVYLLHAVRCGMSTRSAARQSADACTCRPHA